MKHRAVAVILVLAMVGPIHPWATLAEGAFDCSVNGFCLSGSIDSLLGLAQGKLNISTYKPWDRVVKSPAAAAWLPLEVEARAAMAELHGVANDTRLPHAALEDLRAYMFIRLVTIAKKKADGGTLSSVEQDALDTFSQLVAARRVRAAEKALEEYARWFDNRCGYTVPPGFGFEQYDPGPCGHGLPSLNPPRPPTKEQFTAYGGALAMKEANEAIKNVKRAALGVDESDETFTYDSAADAEAAYRTADDTLAVAAAVTLTVAASGAAAIAAVTSTTTAALFATLSGSWSIFATANMTAAATGAAVTGVGVAASLPAFIIIAVVVAVVASVQFAEDQSILPALQESLEKSRVAPDIWTLASSEEQLNRVELFATVVNQTLPSYDEERLAGAMPAPSERQPGDPQFEVNGVDADVLSSVSPDSKAQETLMSRGWFVTRTLSDGVWGPWRWSLYLHYVSLSSTGQLTHHTAGIQPGGFFVLQQLRDADGELTEVTAAAKVSELHVFSPSALADRTVKWQGNHAPRLAPAVSEEPKAGVPLTFQANASDPDIGDSITAIKWFIQDPIYGITIPFSHRDLAECSFNPPGRIIDGLPAECPWRPVDGASFDFTFTRSGTYGVLVMARDSEGAVTQEQFNVVIGALTPTLTITSPPVSGPETVDVTVGGTLEFPYFSPGRYRAVTKLVIDWGDGALTEKWYPCQIPTAGSPAPEDCLADFDSSVGALFRSPAGTADSPWHFSFSHSYAHRADRPLPTPSAIKVYAITNEGGRSQTDRFEVSISNVPPQIFFRPICTTAPPGSLPIICTEIFDRRDVPFGQALKIRGQIVDQPLATHFVHVLWGDGAHTSHQTGCTASGCPGFGEPWDIPGVVQPGKNVDLIYTYPKPGIYPIKITIDDRGPNGKVEYLTQSVIFGISELAGPDTVDAESPATYTYQAFAPAGWVPDVTPTCEGGTVTAQTASSFTCEFDNVTAKTDAQVTLTAVINGHTFERTLDVDVLPALMGISEIGGPLQVTEGTSATFTYSVTNPPPGTVAYTPYCGPHGIVEHEVDGASFTCRFAGVGAVTPTVVAVTVTVADADAEAYSERAVTIEQDTTGPILTLPSTLQRDSTSNAGAIVTFSASASDAISGSAELTCAPQSGSLFPIGPTTVNCSATDWQNNTASGSFEVVVRDVSPPTLTLPGSLTANATSPAGAVVTFNATATDVVPASPTVTCTPASGSTFAIGTTTVSCAVSDTAGNSASGSFAVTVTGPTQQIANLEAYVRSLKIDKVTKSALLSWIEKAKKSIAAGKPSACVQLTGAATVAQLARGSTLTIEQADRILADIARIRAILGC